MIFNRLREINYRIGIRRLLIVISLLICIGITTNVTIAWLSAQSQLVSNSFESSEVSCEIIEEFTDDVKRNVSIQNTGTMYAYIRVALIPLWKDGNDIAGVSATLADCNIDFGDAFGSTWVLGNDGYYYCIDPIAANAYTPILIDECRVNLQNDYKFELQIVAQAIQALPDTAVLDVWGNSISAINAVGSLEVIQ